MSTVKKIVEDYQKFSGVRSSEDIKALLKRAADARTSAQSEEFYQLAHICRELSRAFIEALKSPGRKLDLTIDPAPLYKYNSGQLGKFVDTGNVPGGGRQDKYWERNQPKIQFEPKNVSIRRGSPIPPTLNLNSERSILNFFAIRAVEYGQWLTQQDRINYLAGCGLALLDLHKVLGFSANQIGMFGFLSVAFGARGRGKALGHFEPSTFAVNLTRFKRPRPVNRRPQGYDRSELLFGSGGVGSFCHEFGHAIDYYSGMFVDSAPHSVKEEDFSFWIALSFAQSNRTKPINELMSKRTPRGAMERLLNKIIWRSPGTYTAYYLRVVKTAEEYELNKEYWTRRNELFARAFEVYVMLKMQQRGWFNTFLHHHKYDSAMYMTKEEFKTVERDFDTLINSIRANIRPGIATFQKLNNITARISVARRKKKPSKKNKNKRKK
jgi:hypothetical protein